MAGRLSDKVALITGASSGIGESTALRFAEEGAKVVIGNRRVEAGEATVGKIKEAGGEATFLKTDVVDEPQIRALVDHAVSTFGRLDIAFNNAGVEGDLGPLHEQTAENYAKIFDINVRGLFLSMKYEIAQMLAHGGGAIINTSSIAGVIGFPNAALYDASKHAVMGLTRSAALEYAQQGIRINAVNPAAIKTDMIDRFTGGDDETIKQFQEMHPVGRMGKPEEIANAVLWLASDEASFVYGHALMVDGGFTAK